MLAMNSKGELIEAPRCTAASIFQSSPFKPAEIKLMRKKQSIEEYQVASDKEEKKSKLEDTENEEEEE